VQVKLTNIGMNSTESMNSIENMNVIENVTEEHRELCMVLS
jgi:hypothetical protein